MDVVVRVNDAVNVCVGGSCYGLHYRSRSVAQL